MKPTICAVLIGRNEERDLPRALKSLDGVADQIVFVDTGSTDDTFAVAKQTRRCHAVTYLGASEPVPVPSQCAGLPVEYRIVNFAQARNHAIELGELSGCTHILWLDCDDEITTPLAIRRAAYMPDACYGIWIEIGGGIRQVHHRLIPAKWHLRFKGWVHEYLVLGDHPQIVLNDACIRHDATAHASSGENSNERNMRILTAQYEAEPDARTAFYLANTHKDGGRWAEACEWYQKRLNYGQAFRDEWLFAGLYNIRCLRQLGKDEAAERGAIYAIEHEAPDWQELRMELAFIAYDRKEWAKCIEEATKALDKPIPQTVLWREPQMYRDQPARYISWCHEHLGNKAQALVWSQLATRLIGGPDRDWARREARLEAAVDAAQYGLGPNAVLDAAPAIVKGLRRMVALHRPGAIGDILMTLNLLPAFKEANPDTDVHYFCSAGLASMDALGGIILAAGADAVMDCASLPQWRKRYDKTLDLVGYPLAEGYPDKPMRLHLLQWFAMEMGLAPRTVWPDSLPSLTLRRPKAYTPLPDSFATIQVKAGWSKFKEWDFERWRDVERRSNMLIIQIGAKDDPLVVCRDGDLRGLRLSDSMSVFANARMHIGIDSFCNHLTNYYWTDEHGGRRVPGVILWGSTQASAAGYPDNVNISKGLECQPCFRENPAISRMPRGPCINPPRATYEDDTPHECMNRINVDEVVEAVRTMWNRTAT